MSSSIGQFETTSFPITANEPASFYYWKSLLHQNAYPVAKKQAENNNLNKLTINMNSPHMQHEKVEIKQNNL